MDELQGPLRVGPRRTLAAAVGHKRLIKLAPMMTIALPNDLKHFITERGLFEGFTRDDSSGGYVALWAVEDIAQENSGIEIDVYAPGFLAFAGNGGGEVFAFDAVGAVYMIPLIGMEVEQAIKVADSFAEFAETFELPAE
jgi:hypothetical protein